MLNVYKKRLKQVNEIGVLWSLAAKGDHIVMWRMERVKKIRQNILNKIEELL